MQADELEQKAERAVRRGELLSAIEHFEAYLAREPDDERVRQRMESVRALLQPSELVSRRRSEPEEPQGQASELSFAEQGEMYASSGRFDAAIAAYRRAVERSPQNELLRERLSELAQLVVETGARAGGERLETPVASQPPVPRAASARSAKASEASFAPLAKAPEKPLPADAVKMLEELLVRIKAGRRK